MVMPVSSDDPNKSGPPFALLLLAAMVAPGQGCGSPGAAPQMPGRQVISGRDVGSPFFWNPSTVAFVRPTQDEPGSGDDVWVLPLDPADGSAEPFLAAENVDWALGRHTLVGDILITGDLGEQVFDLQSRSHVNLYSIGHDLTAGSLVPGMTLGYSVMDYSAVRRDGGVVVAYRRAAGRSSLLVGRPPDFAQIADIVVTGMDFLGTDLAVLGHPVVAPVGGPMDTMVDSLYRMAIPSGELAQFPVPTFAPVITGTLKCGVFADPPTRNDFAPCSLFRVVGCRENDAPCPGSDHSPCAILYQRTVDDGATPPTQKPFAYDVVSGQEIALSGLNLSGFSISPDQHRVAWLPSANFSADPQSPADETAVSFRDFCTGDAGQCSLLQPVQLGWRSDSEALVVTLSGGARALLRFPTGECTILAGSASLFDLQFSPENQHLVWQTLPATRDSSVWISDARGDGARVLAAGHVGELEFSPDGLRALITRFQNEDRLASSVWVNLADVPPVEHPLAGASDGAGLLGDRRALLIDRWNTQDATGTLELLDLDRGGRQDLAREVSAFATPGSPDDATEVAYIVHGRFASNHDGLWLTTLPASP